MLGIHREKKISARKGAEPVERRVTG